MPFFLYQPSIHIFPHFTHPPSYLLRSIDDTSVVPKLERSNSSNSNSIDKGCSNFLKEKTIAWLISLFILSTQLEHKQKVQLYLELWNMVLSSEGMYQ